MFETIQGWGVSIESTECAIEDTVKFVYTGISFLLMYDRASVSNRSIYPFTIESTLDNDGDGGPETWAATRSLHAQLKEHLPKTILEDDSY